MAGSVRKRQKKLEKSRKKRQVLKKDARKLEAKYEGKSLLRLAASAPFGPCWLSVSLDEPETEGPPALVTVVVTRRVRGLLLGEVALVDRTCLGLKNGNLLPHQPEQELRDYIDQITHGIGEFRECDPIEAQSVVFHALDYARSLGFAHHPDFEPALFEPRPESLRETPLAHPARPIYISGPDDDVDMIVSQLEEVVGPDNYDLVTAGPIGNWFDDGEDEEDEDDDEDADADADAIETTAQTVEDLE